MSITSYITSKTGKRILCTIGITILLVPYIALSVLCVQVWVSKTYENYMLQACNGVEHITQEDIDLLRQLKLLPLKEPNFGETR